MSNLQNTGYLKFLFTDYKVWSRTKLISLRCQVIETSLDFPFTFINIIKPICYFFVLKQHRNIPQRLFSMHFLLRYLNLTFRCSHVPVCASFLRIYLKGVNLTVVYDCPVYKYIYGSFFFTCLSCFICLKLGKHIYAHTYY